MPEWDETIYVSNLTFHIWAESGCDIEWQLVSLHNSKLNSILHQIFLRKENKRNVKLTIFKK